MKTLILLAGAVVLASTSPALAKNGKGQGNPHVAHQGQVGYGTGGCPPGLAKKGCLPPGQAKKLYGVGQRLPYGFNGWTPYNRIPYDLRTRYGLNPDGRYIYDQNYIYQVDPATLAVQRILNAIL